MKRYIFLILFLLVTSSSFGWGRRGHTIIAEGAYAMLTPEKQKKLMAILAQTDLTVRDGDKMIDNPTTIADAAFWMDEIRHHSATYKKMDNWHFSNIDNALPGDNVADAIKMALDKFKKAESTNESRKLQILILLHLIGDIHQPLHCGYKNDYGGNAVDVSCSVCKNSKTNIHHIWDNEIILFNKMTTQSINEVITTLNKKGIDTSDVTSWQRESVTIVRDKKCYPATSEIDERYLTQYKNVVEIQLARATVRLHAILDAIL